jgi:hypothetical protein
MNKHQASSLSERWTIIDRHFPGLIGTILARKFFNNKKSGALYRKLFEGRKG